MTRTQAIDIITSHISRADDATLETIAAHIAATGKPNSTGDLLEAFPTDSVLPRALTERELALIAQSKADFKAGRTLSSDEMWSKLDDHLAARGVPRSTP